ncbi:MAG: sigma-70 family RNA polymerase sigma factor [Bdellovibrionales bacterium]|nr:sigma-70 family RNA polymerase sigma factor [Bdellovibrionales bacterium]
MPSETALDQQWMRLYVEGDTSAFDLIYRENASRVFGYIAKRIRSDSERHDVFQAVWMKFHQARHQYDPKFPLTQWIYVIAKTVLIDHFRKKGHQVTVDSEVDVDRLSQPEGGETLNPSMDREAALERLKGLTAEQKQVVEMRVLDELSFQQSVKS